MFSQPNLSQSKQPNVHYDYDGLSGGWLWLPWWVHIGVALLIWPICWWGLPLLPFQNISISEFLSNYKIQIASAISILTVMTAFLSYLKAYRIRHKKKSSITTRTNQQVSNETMQKEIKTTSTKSKAKRVVKSVKKMEEKTVKKNSNNNAQKTTKSSGVKAEKKPIAKKKRTVAQKKNGQQTQLDL